MTTGEKMWAISISLLILYIFVQIFNFYGFDSSYYGIYFTFYLFLLVTLLVLPKKAE
jgi:hypothetical protein